MDRANRPLLRHGAMLIVAALAVGVLIPMFTNPRMGLSAHVGGLMIGMLLMVYGAAWGHVRLPAHLEPIAHGLSIWGGWLNFVALTLAALLGTSTMTPIAGAGHSAHIFSETVVNFFLIVGAITILGGAGLVARGLTGRD